MPSISVKILAFLISRGISMKIDFFVGTWELVGGFTFSTEVCCCDDEEQSDLYMARDWLLGRSHRSIKHIKPTEGLTLTITADGRFTEEKTGDPVFDGISVSGSEVTYRDNYTIWYDEEGLYDDSEVIPFNGCLKFTKSYVYLLPDDEILSRINRGENEVFLSTNDLDKILRETEDLILRLNDTEHLISEFIEVRSKKIMTRTVNAVTDGLYLDRLVTVYQRADDC
jgi:hypothetical protein